MIADRIKNPLGQMSEQRFPQKTAVPRRPALGGGCGRNTGGDHSLASSPHGALQRRRSAAGLFAGRFIEPAMRRKGAAGPAESGENPQGKKKLTMESNP